MAKIMRLHKQLQRLPIALQTMHITYRLYDQWITGSNPLTRSNALIAKTRGLIAYDHIMNQEDYP